MHMLTGFRGILGCLLLLLVMIVAVSLMSPAAAERLVREGGPVENASVALYLLSCCWLLALFLSGRFRHGFASATLILCLALRELDFHDRFTTMGIFKTRYYLSASVPPLEKAIAAGVVVLLLAGIIWYVRTYGPLFLTALRRHSLAALCVLLAIGSAVVAKTFDSFSSELEKTVYALVRIDLTNLTRTAEEILELGIPLFILLAVANGLRERKG